jgi:alpha-1,3-glucan synthase
MHTLFAVLSCLGLGGRLVHSLRYSAQYVDYNLNQHPTATNPLDYVGYWQGHNFTASPENWRFPVYTLFLDRFVNGDPSNDNANGTAFEQDIYSTQLRHGGDIMGLMDSLDYIQGMGVKVGWTWGSWTGRHGREVDTKLRASTSPGLLSSTSHGRLTLTR